MISIHELHCFDVGESKFSASAHIVSSGREWEVIGNVHTAIKAEFPGVVHLDIQIEHPEKRKSLICYNLEN